MWVKIVQSLLIGLAFGGVVAVFNHWLVWSWFKKTDKLPPAEAKKKLMVRYLIRYLINVLTLATYLLHRDTYLLIGTAAGLVLLGKILSINTFFNRKEAN